MGFTRNDIGNGIGYLSLLFFSGQCLAAEWSTDAGVRMNSAYSDNVQLASINETSSTSYTAEPRLLLQSKEVHWNLSLDSRLKSTRYADLEESDSDNVFLSLSSGYFTERSASQLSIGYTRNTTFDYDVDTQLLEAGLEDEQVEKTIRSLSPSWSWQLNETSSVSINGGMQDIDYDKSATSSFIGELQYNNIGVTYGWDFSENHYLSFSANMSNSEYNEIDYEYDTFGLQTTYRHSFNEKSDISLYYGETDVDSVFHNQQIGCEVSLGPFCLVPLIGDRTSNVTTDLYGMTLNIHSELSHYKFSVDRKLNPSSVGGALQSDNAGIQYRYSYNSRLSFSMGVSYSQTDTLDGVNDSQDRDQSRFASGLMWKLTEHWDLGVRYRYVEQIMENTNEESVSNSIFINLSLRWPKVASSY